MPRGVYKRGRYKQSVMLAAVRELQGGTSPEEIAERLGCSSRLLYKWRVKLGKLSKQPAPKEAKANGAHAPAGLTPEKLFNTRVHEAIVLLRQAQSEVDRLKAAGKIKEPDTAHLYAQLALRTLQGDNGK